MGPYAPFTVTNPHFQPRRSPSSLPSAHPLRVPRQNRSKAMDHNQPSHRFDPHRMGQPRRRGRQKTNQPTLLRRQDRQLYHYRRKWRLSSEWKEIFHPPRIRLSTEFPPWTQVRLDWSKETNWQCGATDHGNGVIRGSEESVNESGWFVN